MSMTIKILIGGLAICYKKDDFWNVIFLCDDIHPVRLTQSEADIKELPLYKKGTNRLITFDFGSTPNPVSENTEEIFNMAAEYAHGRGALVVPRNIEKTVIRMKIPSAKFNTHILTDREYFVQYIGDGTVIGDPITIIGRVAHIISATITTNTDIKMTVEDEATGGETPLPFTVSLPYADGATLTFDFNNDCREHCRGNDFLDLYHWVKDLDGAGKERRFVAGQIRNSVVNGKLRVHRMAGDEEFLATKSLFSSLQGNCDPVAILPPPDGTPDS